MKKINIGKSALLAFIATALIRGFSGSGINMSASLFLKPVSEELGVGIGTLSIFFSIASLVMIFWLPVAGKLIEKYDVRLLVIVSAALQGLSFASLGLFKNVIFWYLMTVPQTLGAGILVNLLGPFLIHRYFKEKTATALGVQMAIVWGFAAVLQPIMALVIDYYGFRSGYFAMGFSAFLVGVLSAVFLLKNENGVKGKEEKIKREEQPAAPSDKSLFFLLFLFVGCLTGVAVFTQYLPSYGALLGLNSLKIGTSVAFSSVGSALGALLIGVVTDKFGIRVTSLGTVFLWTVSLLGFVFCKQYFTIFAFSTFLHGVCSSSIAVLLPSLAAFIYGDLLYEKMYSRLAISAPAVAIALIPAYGFLYDYTKSFNFVFLSLFALLLLAAVSGYLIFRGRVTRHYGTM